jgi:hypothetical protein
MDNTEKYMQMCYKAEEIHIFKPVSKGYWDDGYYIGSLRTKYVHLTSSDYETGPEKCDKDDIWLLTQDQIQALLFNDNSLDIGQQMDHLMCSVLSGYEIGNCWLSPYFSNFTSWEQIWFAFLMQQKYNKFWNGTDWT